MNPYLKTKILTASPQELRLMLYEGAIKFCRQAHHAITLKDWEGMFNSLQRAQKIVMELSNSLKHDVDPDLTGKLTSLYTYIYRRLIDANMERDGSPVTECIDLLEYQRQTWQMVITKLREQDLPQGADESDHTPHTPAEQPNPIGRITPEEAADRPQRVASLSVQG